MAGGKPGKPQVNIDEYMRQIEPFLKLGCSLHQSCLQAKIPYTTVKDHMRYSEEIRNKIEAFQNLAVVAARKVVVENILKYHDVDSAKWYLERKAKKEFSLRVEQTGKGGTPIEVNNFDLSGLSNQELQNLKQLKEKANVESNTDQGEPEGTGGVS